MFQQHSARLRKIEPHGVAFPVGDRLVIIRVNGKTLLFNNAVDEHTSEGVQNSDGVGVLRIQSGQFG